MRKWIAVVWVLGLGVVATACGGGGSSGPAGACETRADCPDGLACIDGRCQSEVPGPDATGPDAQPDAGAGDTAAPDNGGPKPDLNPDTPGPDGTLPPDQAGGDSTVLPDAGTGDTLVPPDGGSGDTAVPDAPAELVPPPDSVVGPDGGDTQLPDGGPGPDLFPDSGDKPDQVAPPDGLGDTGLGDSTPPDGWLPPEDTTPGDTVIPPNNRLWLNEFSACMGETAEGVIEIAAETVAIDSITFDISFDPSALEFVSCEPGDLDPGWLMFNCNVNEPGNIRGGGFVLPADALPPGATGAFIRLHFNVLCVGCAAGEAFPLDFVRLQDDLLGFEGTGADFVYCP